MALKRVPSHLLVALSPNPYRRYGRSNAIFALFAPFALLVRSDWGGAGMNFSQAPRHVIVVRWLGGDGHGK